MPKLTIQIEVSNKRMRAIGQCALKDPYASIDEVEAYLSNKAENHIAALEAQYEKEKDIEAQMDSLTERQRFENALLQLKKIMQQKDTEFPVAHKHVVKRWKLDLKWANELTVRFNRQVI